MANHYFEVQTCLIFDQWENCWTETNEDEEGTPWVFDTYQDAEDELFLFIEDTRRASMDYELGDYRIVEKLNGRTHAMWNF